MIYVFISDVYIIYIFYTIYTLYLIKNINYNIVLKNFQFNWFIIQNLLTLIDVYNGR
jgi:succinate dehydrogenase hydrophobic anchor subunit